ncbi:MAG: GDSL-type esterase/lipase family protein [Anaerolineae bacterium]|jgi:lysophospholipase L1-like esterase|nr:GDSL-type esterase/lipase family protein [Anaerolineae bacterium]
MKLVFLGDSLTWGGYGGNFVAQVAARLPAHEVINAGVGGDTVVNLLARLDEVLALSPDVVFIMVGGNDAVSYTVPAVRPYYQAVKKLPGGSVAPEDFTTAYRDLLTRLQLHFVQPLIGLGPTEYNRELVAARRHYNALTRAVAAAFNIPVLDLDTPFTPAQPIERPPVTLDFIRQIGERSRRGWQDYETERRQWGYTYSFDGMHLTPATATAFAGHIVAFLQAQAGV